MGSPIFQLLFSVGLQNFLRFFFSLYKIKYNILKQLFRDLSLIFTPEKVEESSIKFLTFSINTKMNDSTTCLSKKSVHTYFNDDDDDDDDVIDNVNGNENGDQKQDEFIMDVSILQIGITKKLIQ